MTDTSGRARRRLSAARGRGMTWRSEGEPRPAGHSGEVAERPTSFPSPGGRGINGEGIGSDILRTRSPFWRDARALAVLAQVLVVVIVALALAGAMATLRRSFIRQNIHLDWSVLRQPAGFDLSALQWTVDLDTLRIKRYEPTDSGLAVGGTRVERFGRLVAEGGYQLTPELAALVIGLAVYTSAFIAEIVRGGIQTVSRGQMEAARSLGLTYRQGLRLIVLPQAFRIIIPPLGNQFLNLTKNSSLALGIGYAELLTAANTVSSQSFRSLEAFTVVTVAYLMVSLVISAGLNLIRRRLATS